MKRHFALGSAATVPLILLAADCSDRAEPEGDRNAPQSTQTLEESTDDYGVAAQDLDNLMLGAKISGVAGTETQSSFVVMADDREKMVAAGDLAAWVACPAEMNSCDPASLPTDTVYTYVYRVTPGVDEPNNGDFPKPDAVVPMDSVTLFRIALPAKSYAGRAGYSLSQAREAMGPNASFQIRCDEGMLSWKTATGDGWKTGEPITFFWQSFAPPIEPIDAFIIEGENQAGPVRAVAGGPSPTKRGDGDVTGCT